MYNPFKIANKFWYTDSRRQTRKREFGACTRLLNTTPLQSDGEALRYGYGTYSGVTSPTGAEIPFVVPVTNPTPESIHLYAVNDSGNKSLQMNPYWLTATKQATTIDLHEKKTLTAVAVSYPTNYKMKLTSPSGMSAVVDYYKGWKVLKGSQHALVTAWDGVDTFTFVEKVDATGYNWGTPVTLTLQRNFHDVDGITFDYNNSKSDPMTVYGENDWINISPGQSVPSANNKPIKVFQHLKREFFPTTAKKFTYEGTYASLRECSMPAKSIVSGSAITDTTGDNGLDVDCTYWIALAYVRDGYQISPLQKFETPASEYTMGSGDWTYNYLEKTAAHNQLMNVSLILYAGQFDKRITDILVYVAKDDGDTHSTGRKNPYLLAWRVPLTSSDYPASAWTGNATSFTLSNLLIENTDKYTESFETNAGFPAETTETMYNHSTELIVGNRHFLANTYVPSETLVDRFSLFTNPRQQCSVLGNAGILAVDIFPNFDVLRQPVDVTSGSKITGLIQDGIQSIIVLKDAGVVSLSFQEITEQGVQYLPSIISYDAGLATVNEWIKDDEGYMYFAGYDDVYRLRSGQLERLIERDDKLDWLYTYRNSITKTQKESICMFYSVSQGIYFDFGQNGKQMLLTRGGWREVAFKNANNAPTEFFKWTTKLTDGSILGLAVNSGGTIQGVKQFANPHGTMYYKDDSTDISYLIDTGDIIASGDPSKDFRLNKFVIDRTMDDYTKGNLDVHIYRDGVLHKTFLDVGKTPGDGVNSSIRVELRNGVEQTRVGYLWRMVINGGSDPEVLRNGNLIQTDALEIHGESISRRKRLLFVAGSGDTPIYDEVVFDEKVFS